MNLLSDKPGHGKAVTNISAVLLADLSKLRHRGTQLVLVSGIAWISAGTFLLTLLFATALGWFGGAALRVGGWLVLLLSMGAIATLTLLMPITRMRKKDAVPRRIGERFPTLASAVLSASQLAANAADSPFSKQLIDLHVQRIHRHLSAISVAEIYPAKKLLGPALAVILAMGIGGLALTTFPGTTAVGLAALWDEPSPPHSTAQVVTTKAPVVGDLSIVLRYPEYLARPDRQLDAFSGNLIAPLGTTVIVAGKSLLPDADRGSIQLPDGTTVPISVNVNKAIHGQFVVGRAGVFSFSLGSRTVLVEGPTHGIEIEPDSAPRIRILRPTGAVEIPQNGSISIAFEAQDDFGLRSVDLVLRGRKKLSHTKTIVHFAEELRQVNDEYVWSPASLQIGDETEFELELEAFDGDLIRGPKSGRSATISVRIQTPVGRHEVAIEQEIEAMDGLIELLGKRLEMAIPASSKEKEVAERFVLMRRETEDLLGKMGRLIRTLNQDTLTSRRVIDSIGQIRQDLSNQLLHEARLNESPILDIQKSKSADRVTVRLLEEAVLELDDILIDQQLVTLVHSGETLQRRRGEIGQLLEQFNQTRSESARRGLLDAVAKMEESIQKLLRSAEKIRGKVADAFINPSALEHIDITASLEKLKTLLASGDLAEASSLLRALEKDVERLMTALEGGLLAFRTDRFGEEDRYVGELIDKVLSVEAEQLQLKRETTSIQYHYQERIAQAMSGRIDELVKRQLRKAAEILDIANGLAQPKDETARMRLVELRVAGRELKLALGQGDLDDVGQIAEDVFDLCREWNGEDGLRTKKKIGAIRDAAKQMIDEIAQAYPAPSRILSERDRRLTSVYATKQRALRSRVQRLREWSDTQNNATSFMTQRTSGALKATIAHMSEAISSLDGQRVRSALDLQGEAIEELARLREDLKRGNTALPIDSRPVLVRSQIELPDPADFSVPPEYRQDIIEAMQGELPQQYREAIRSYYETLVR